ncbi:MAG: DNA primase, partial [Proteobacteria bacterium]|nr:DNA primase [Pseudomonadota bacterium]
LGRIPEATIDEIRNRVDIVDLIGRYVELKKAGRSYKGLCPFHNEKTPSFNVSPDRQIYHCFGCDVGGDVIGFLMSHETLTFPEAARILAREIGIEIPETAPGERGVSERVFAAIELAQKLYREALDSPAGARARAYLADRGLDAETIERFGIGFAPDRWDAVTSALAAAGIPSAMGEKAGLLAERQRGGHYDRLRGRVVFPISDVRGRVIGFGGRALAADQEPKYLNTTESPVFRKRESFYGFPFALEAIRRSERAIICEGYFDRIALHRAGLAEGLATCGTALTREHGRQLARRTRQAVLLFDGDEAGSKALERALEVLLPEGLRIRGAALPAGHDPDTFLAAEGSDALRELVDKAPDALELVMQRALDEGRASPAEKADAVGRVAPLIALVTDPVERAEFVRRLAVAAGADARAVESVVRAAGRGVRAPASELPEARPRRAKDPVEERQLRLLAALLFRHPRLAERRGPERTLEFVPDGSWKAVLEHLFTAAGEGALDSSGALDLFRVEEGLDEEARSRLREIAFEEALRESETPVEDAFDQVLDWFARRQRKAASEDLTRRMQEPDADDAALLAEKQRQLEERRAAQGITPGSTP